MFCVMHKGRDLLRPSMSCAAIKFIPNNKDNNETSVKSIPPNASRYQIDVSDLKVSGPSAL